MSTDWDVYCMDCKERHGFDDCNHWEEEMLFLCKHADAIAGIAEFMAGGPGLNAIELQFGHGGSGKQIRPEWFGKHLGHNLQPISEYGHFIDQCGEYVTCGECDRSHRCALSMKHDGPHRPKASPVT